MAKIFKRKLIFDNAVFSNFSRIEKLDLLYYLADEIITTKEVAQEVKKGISKIPKLFSIIEAIENNLIKIDGIKKIENILIASELLERGQLGMGEISTMVLALEMEGVFVTDDELATMTAINLGIDVMNLKEYRDTVTILTLLKENKIISEKERREIIKMLKKENFSI